MLYILDTDHVSLLQRGHRQVVSNLTHVDVHDRAVTIITAAEQMQGRLAVIRRARTEADAARAFSSLQNTIAFYQTVQVLPYNEKAYTRFVQLRRQKIRVGTQDLRIATIALSHQAILVTRNTRDFSLIPELSLEDWSV